MPSCLTARCLWSVRCEMKDCSRKLFETMLLKRRSKNAGTNARQLAWRREREKCSAKFQPWLFRTFKAFCALDVRRIINPLLAFGLVAQ